MRWMRTLAGLLLALLALPAAAADTGFLAQVVTVDGVPHRYVVYVPVAPRGARLPVVLALHGSGERGDDGWVQTDVGLGHAIRQHPERWPAVVVFPQAPAGADWITSRRLALATLAAAEHRFHTDPARVYAAGLSLGGNGVWELARTAPKRFAAVVAICGFVGPVSDFPGIAAGGTTPSFAAVAQQIAPLPVWIVHGDADPNVPVAESRQMAAALTAAGSEVHYHELPGVGHDAWDPGFGDPALPVWLFAQRRR